MDIGSFPLLPSHKIMSSVEVTTSSRGLCRLRGCRVTPGDQEMRKPPDFEGADVGFSHHREWQHTASLV